MNNFKNIQELWKKHKSEDQIEVPEALLQKIKRSSNFVNSSHMKSILVLSATCLLISTGYYLIIGKGNLFTQMGIFLMVSALLVRIVIEWKSLQRIKALDFLSTSTQFAKELAVYYQWRARLHKYPTLLIVLVYCIGVAILFVQFYHYLPRFWFHFFLIELVIMAIVLFFFIRKKIRKEMAELFQLVELYNAAS